MDYLKLEFPNTYNDKLLIDNLREKAQDTVIRIIKNNRQLAESIFMGKGWFVDPYYANYLFVHGDLISNEPTDFIVTTGSGRSKGKYTIVIKPKY